MSGQGLGASSGWGLVTGDLNTTFGYRSILLRVASIVLCAAPSPLNLLDLLNLLNLFRMQSRDSTLLGLTLNLLDPPHLSTPAKDATLC